MKSYLHLLIGIFIVFGLANVAKAQTDNSTRPSPAMEAKGTFNKAQIAINYSSPSVKGRKIWGDLVPYGKVWRTGANEATIFESDKDLMIQGQKLPAGKYGLFTIPGETEWTWIFNSVWEQWGAYKYDETKDVLRIKSTSQPSPVYHEQMTFLVEKGKVSLYWENLSVSF